MLLAERVRPSCSRRCDAAGDASDELRAGAAALEAWDEHVGAQSRGAVLFQRFWDATRPRSASHSRQRWNPLNPAARLSGWPIAARRCGQLEAAVRATRAGYGSETVAWGDVHRFRFGSLDLPATAPAARTAPFG